MEKVLTGVLRGGFGWLVLRLATSRAIGPGSKYITLAAILILGSIINISSAILISGP